MEGTGIQLRSLASTGYRPNAVDIYRAKDKTVREICRLMGISKPTLYAYVAEAETRP